MSRIRDAWASWKQRTERERRQWYALLVIAGLLIPVLGVPSEAGENLGGFEIDADDVTPIQNAYYADFINPSGEAGTDWAMTDTAHPGGIFTPASGMTGTAVTGCYGSNVDRNPDVAGVATFICDGHAKFKSSEPEQNLVSPAGKSNDGVWPIKPGNVKGKNDITHGYVFASLGDSDCDSDSDHDNVFLHVGGNRGDNEGDAFWGFEFNAEPPDCFMTLTANSGAGFDLTFDRSEGDILIAAAVTSGQVFPQVYTVVGDPGPGATANFQLNQGDCNGNATPGEPGDQGETALVTNQASDTHDVLAPPWNVPVCDPTATNSANQCRLVNGGATDNLVGDRLFAEATIDLAAFGINTVCVSSVIFTSRASTSSSADIDDVAGGDFDLCGDVRGSKFHDQNKDSVWQKTGDNAEPGLSGWTIHVYSDDGTTPGELDSGDGTAFSATTTTTTGGAYTFTGLQPGNYIVCEELQDDWTQSYPLSTTTTTASSAANCSDDPYEDGLAEWGHVFVMSPAGVSGLDFGNFSEGTVSGLKFKDVDANGLYSETTDTALSGWTISVFSDDDGSDTLSTGDGTSFSATMTTTVETSEMSAGLYSFDLPPGDYIVCEATAANWTQTAPTNTICAGGTGLAPGGHTVTVASGAVSGNNDFGNAPLSTITVLFNDLTGFTEATSISCVDRDDNSVGTTTAQSLTTNVVTTDQSDITCTISFKDP